MTEHTTNITNPNGIQRVCFFIFSFLLDVFLLGDSCFMRSKRGLSPHCAAQMLLMHAPEQHCALVVQDAPPGRHEAARAGVGATIEVTRGKAATAVMPRALIICRRL